MAQSAHLIDGFLQLMRQLRRHYDGQAQAVGLTMSRARALTALSRSEGATQSELAAMLDIEAPTLKRQIDALEQAGFVTRQPTQGDARKNALFLTDRGRHSDIVDFTRRLRADLTADISPQDLALARDVLARMGQNLTRMSQP